QNEFADKVRELDNALQQSNKSLMRSERAFDSSDLFSRQFLMEDSPENTLLRAVQFIKDEFGYSFVGAYLVDEKNENAAIRTSAGLPEGLKLDDDQRIRLSDPGNISYAITHAEVRLIPNARDERFAGSNLLLPDTQSELILPLTYQNRVLGAIDIQSNRMNTFSPIELKSLRTYVSQIVVAFQKARLSEELKRKDEELNTALRQYTQQTWHNHLKQGKRKFSIRYRQNILEKGVPPSGEANKVINQGETIIIPNQPAAFLGKPSTTIAVPIRLRDQVIGVLNLKVEASQLPRDMMPLIESISNRMALALENARLLEEIQAKADREHLVSEISNRIRSSPNVEQVLRTAVSEIGLSLGASEVMIKLQSNQ
ncbi:MAG TPA: GAF domain-containing protein, partial [Anaerolineaceae bacterium]|nr:GAF domain-containing protein [Anaerolineaceae bacterium]